MFTENQRVQAHPATDAWMRGDRYGTVVRVTGNLVTVSMDKSGSLITFTDDLVIALS